MRRATGVLCKALGVSNNGIGVAATQRAAALGVLGGQQLRCLQGSGGTGGSQAPQVILYYSRTIAV